MRALTTIPHRPPATTPVRDRSLPGVRSTTGHHLRRRTAHPCTVTHVSEPAGWLRRWRERMRALPFSREQQFGLLEVALREQLRREGKPPDAIKLQRPDDLPAPLGTPVRLARRDPLYARNGDDRQAPHNAPRPKAAGPRQGR
jgi:hypothetical protein